MTTGSHLIPLTLVALTLGCGIGQSYAEQLRPNQKYAGGTRVESSGVSFVVPTDWIGAYGQDARNQALVMGSNTVEGVGLAILKAGLSGVEVATELNETQDLGTGVKLRPTGPPNMQGSRIAARYENEIYVGRALVVLGTARNSVIFFFAGPKKNERAYAQLLADLAASTKILETAGAAPSPQPSDSGELTHAWVNLLSGMMLHYFSGYNSGGGSGGMSSHRVLHLCRDGRFAYSGDSMITMNVPGASASRGGRGGHSGQWEIESTTQTSAVLVLTPDGNRPVRLHVEYDGDKTFVNGQRWLRADSDACR